MAVTSGKGATETDTFVASQQPKAAAPGKWKSFMNFLYEKDTGKVLGRTGKSWLQITVFYLIFYGVLAAFFAVLLILFLQTLDKHEPKWKGEHGIIGTSPGMGFRPVPPDSGSTLIWVRPRGNMTAYTNGLRTFLQPYEDGQAGAQQGAGQQPGPDMMSCPPNTNKLGTDNKKACLFEVNQLGNCVKEKNFGYDHGQPCVLLKLNRIYGWKPEAWDLSKESQSTEYMQLQSSYAAQDPLHRNLTYNANTVYVTCQGEDAVDKEHMGPIRIQPEGFGSQYFPFMNQPGYVSPVVMVEFLNPSPGVVINVECRAWAKNIQHNRADRLGVVHFELLVDK